ncbi:MAG TPA: catalase [Solirubrobacterales bacterium]|nr:catalase [Solirubrobacterales bacterium]
MNDEPMRPTSTQRVPERVVHAKGSAAHGFFETTEDVSQFTAAGLFRKGVRTPLFLRFSTEVGELGSADTARDLRGFAIKFFTDEGSYDLVGNNTPVFFIRDPAKFPDYVYSQKRLPDTGMRSNEAQWDFWTLAPESAHQVAILMSDRGTPRTLRHMNGYGSHTFSWVNAGAERFWVKYHFKTVQGIENYTAAEAVRMAAEDPDAHRRDLRRAIDAGEAPEWRLEMQVMPVAEAAGHRFDPFDVTKVWPHGDYPPVEVGRLVLDRNPKHFFAEVEQSGFSPANLVPGIGLSPDEMLMGRIRSYPRAPGDLQPEDGAGYQREGGRSAYEDDDFGQAGALYREVMDEAQRQALAANVAAHASVEVSAEVQDRVVAYWTQVDSVLGARVAAALQQ